MRAVVRADTALVARLDTVEVAGTAGARKLVQMSRYCGPIRGEHCPSRDRSPPITAHLRALGGLAQPSALRPIRRGLGGAEPPQMPGHKTL